jgi:hypothetical protein
MRSRRIDDIDRELSALAMVHSDLRRSGGEVTTLAIDGLLDERLMAHSALDEPPTEEFVPIQLPDPTSR